MWCLVGTSICFAEAESEAGHDSVDVGVVWAVVGVICVVVAAKYLQVV